MKLPLRIGLALSLGFLLVLLGVFGVLGPRALADYNHQHDLRLQFRLQNLRAEVENRVAYGLALSEIRGIQGVLETVALADPEIRSIEVFTPEGLTLFSTDRALIGDQLSQDRLQALPEQGAAGGKAGIAIRNDLGETVGMIVLSTSGADGARLLERDLLWLLASVAAGGLVLALVLGQIIGRLAERGSRAVILGLRADGRPMRHADQARRLGAEARAVIGQAEAELDLLSQRLAGADHDKG